MKVIYKYTLDLSVRCSIIEMPKNAKILCVHSQGHYVCVWAESDPKEKDIEKRYFEVFITGKYFEEDMGQERNYLGTVFLEQDNFLVFHVYEYTGI